MRAAAALWANDVRSVVRDRTVAVLLVVPFVFVVFLRFGVPLIEQYEPLVREYRTEITALFCLLAGTFPALTLSFIMLDEKDEGLFEVFRVLPLSPAMFLFSRLGMVAVPGLIYPLIILTGSSLVSSSAAVIVALAALCALQAPMATLIVVALARNKIEGLTIIKGLFPALVFPVAGVVSDGWWTPLLGVLPAYWIYAAFAAPDAATLGRAAAGAVALHAIVVAVFYRRFRRRVLP